ncbi:oligo-1,6-glucosidase-like [Condylostylus longicornis]|uniref:oligo-1,6-glucosidase-like n=1 Tax=Condylostylus longicornis TaxID=2530218 RepID=UPI00244E2D16|nr:oligo-1,6-glucosidase-like [Condylostylus longicornis]
MNINLGISTEPSLLGVDLPSNGGTISESPSVSTFLPEEDASICPLLPTTPSPPLVFSHPLTPSAGDNCSDNSGIIPDTKAETSSSGSSTGIAMDVNENTTATTLFNKNAYHHLGKNSDSGFHQESGLKQNGNILNLPLSKDAPCFVSWNWPLIRKCTFFVFMSSLLAMCAIVVAMIITLPKTCNPKAAWFRGSVFYEIFPASFKDSNKNGVGDLQGITSHVEDLQRLGFGAIRLNSIFASYNYPDQYENITSLLEIDKSVGTPEHLEELAMALHSKNMSLILDLPINIYLPELENFFETDEFSGIDDNDTYRMSQKMEDPVGNTMLHWLRYGIDGFYIKGIELYKDKNDKNLIKFFRNWKYLLGEDRVIIIDYNFFNNMDKSLAKSILNYVDLVEFYLDISKGTKNIKEQIDSIYTQNDLIKPGEKTTWIQWSLGGVNRQRLSKDRTSNATLAATIMQIMLPGTPNIFYGDEISLNEFKDPNKEHTENKNLHHLPPMKFSNGARFTNGRSLPWLPESNDSALENAKDISKMIKLRDRSPSIYKNSISKDDNEFPNTNIRSGDDIIVIERNYPRRNSFVSVSNFGKNSVQVDLSSFFYSGQILIGGKDIGKIYFSDFEIGPMETIVIKLDK